MIRDKISDVLDLTANAAALRQGFRRLGFAEPARAVANLEALTPTPRDTELLAPAWPRLAAELAASPDPDMALNNLERDASAADRAVIFRTLAEHPGAAQLIATIAGASQFLADTLRRRPSLFTWLLEPTTMRPWLAEELAADLAASLGPVSTRDARMNALRRFKYRHLLRIGARDLLGDADLIVTTEELSRVVDVCLGAVWQMAEDATRAQYGPPRDADGAQTGMAIVAMGKLGGEELNYSSDIDLMFAYGADGETDGGAAGRLANGAYFERVCRAIVAQLEDVTEEGSLFRVDLRLRPEGRSGPVVLSLDGYRTYYRERAELWERQALLKSRIAAGDERVGASFAELARDVVYRPGVDPGIAVAIRAMKREIDRSVEAKGGEELNVKLGRGGIREIEFLVQALQLLYGGDDPWLRQRHSLKAIFRLAERGYLVPELGRTLSHAYVHLRTVEHRLQILHELQTHTLPREPVELGRLARRLGFTGSPRVAARAFAAYHRGVTRDVHRAFREFFAEPEATSPRRLKPPSLVALRATGFRDPERARHNLKLVVEGRPLVPYAGAMREALERLYPALLDEIWKSPDLDEALNQFERFLAAAGPRVGLIELLAKDREVLSGLLRLCAGGDLLTQLLIAQPELLTSLVARTGSRIRREADFRVAFASVFAPGLTPGDRRDALRRVKQAEELGIVWRYLLSVTTIEGYSREMTALAEATLAAGSLLVLGPLVERHGVPRGSTGAFVPAVVVGMGKLGGRELTTGSDLDLFAAFSEDGETDGPERIEAHASWSAVAERLSGSLGDVTAPGVAFPVDMRLRPGSKGSGFASSQAALERYYEEWGDLWERQTLTRARVVVGDPRLARRIMRSLRRVVYGSPLPRTSLKEITQVRHRMEVELGKETPGRYHVKYGKGGLVDVEFLTQALQLVHGAENAAVRRTGTIPALVALGRAGALVPDTATAMADHYRVLRRVSAALRLLGARPADVLELAGPMPARVASALGYASRAEFLEDYRRRTGFVRATYKELLA